MPENEDVAPVPTAEAPQDVAQASDAKAEATGTASDERSEDDLEAVAGGYRHGKTAAVPAANARPIQHSRAALESLNRVLAMSTDFLR